MKYCPYCGAVLRGGAASFCAECGRKLPSGRRKKPHHRPDSRREPPRNPKHDPRDEGYDGYYDDVKPVDGGRVREGMNPDMIKGILILAGSASGIIIFAVMLMFLL